MSYNDITSEGSRFLTVMLRSNSKLNTLGLGNNQVLSRSLAGFPVLISAFCLDWQRRREGNLQSAEGKHRIAAAASGP